MNTKNLIARSLPVIPVVLLIATLALLIASPLAQKFIGPAPIAHATGTDLGTLTGNAWSDNLGWICISTANCPAASVVVKSDGTLAGYAWANPSDDASGTDNIGWISFNAADTASCGATATLTGATITGWAKVLSADNNGWDGCISLSGSGYSTTLNSSGSSQPGTLGGYAWADSTVGGWISFNCATGGPTANDICATSNYAVVYTPTTPPPPSVTINKFIGSPTRVRSGNTSSLVYIVTSTVSCTITGSDGTSYPVTADSVQHSITTSAITKSTNYILACSTISANATIGVLPVYIEQ